MRAKMLVVLFGSLSLVQACGSSPTGNGNEDARDVTPQEAVQPPDGAGGDSGVDAAVPDSIPADVPATDGTPAETVDYDLGPADAKSDTEQDGAGQPDLPAVDQASGDEGTDQAAPLDAVVLPEPGLWCVGKVSWPDPPQDTYSYTYHAIELLTDAYLPGVGIKICSAADATCATPVAEGTTDASGAVTLTIPAGPQGLDGFVEFVKGDLVPQVGFYSYVDNVAKYGGNAGLDYYVLPKATLAALEGGFGLSLAPGRGLIMATFLDCDDQRTAGVTISCPAADDKTTVLYTQGGVPTPGMSATSVDGHASLYNVPAGWTELHAVHAQTGTLMGVLPVLVREGYTTGVVIGPTPLP